jgi:hypothetical protein
MGIAMLKVELRRKLLVLFVVGISTVLMLHPRVAGLWSTPAAARVADPPPIPCSKQNWTNADRICLSWTAPRGDVGQTIAAATSRDRMMLEQFPLFNELQ